MATGYVVDQRLDCKGLNCPLPVIKTKKAIETMAVGQVLEMVATDKGSKRTWSWSEEHGARTARHPGRSGVLFLLRAENQVTAVPALHDAAGRGE
jgi:TusA-related sulfurtransferase